MVGFLQKTKVFGASSHRAWDTSTDAPCQLNNLKAYILLYCIILQVPWQDVLPMHKQYLWITGTLQEIRQYLETMESSWELWAMAEIGTVVSQMWVETRKSV